MTSLPERHPDSLFCSMEGGEGGGKSTQIRVLAERLRSTGREVVVTREPGGCPSAEFLRGLILGGDPAWDPVTELLLFAAARREHVVHTIAPALARGAIVLCDRFSESSRAYQGAARGLGTSHCDDLERIACGGILPDLVILIDVAPEVGIARSMRRATDSLMFEQLEMAFHHALRNAYLERAAERSDLFTVVPSTTMPETTEAVWAAFVDRFPAFRRDGDVFKPLL